jgi:uncharacterized cupredoxin-like copper-binding protein
MHANDMLVGPAPKTTASAFTWRTLLYSAAICEIAVLVVMGILQRDRLPLGLAVVAALGLALLNYRSGLWGALVLGLLFADIAFWTLGATVANVVYGEEFVRLLFPAALAGISAAGLVAAVVVAVWRKNPAAGGEAAWIAGLIAGGLFLLAIGVGFVTAGNQPAVAPANVIRISTENMAFSTAELVTDNGEMSVIVNNPDLWWHTFTIDALGVDLRLPSGGRRQVTFSAEPGVYEFYCAIPGHDVLGMRGTLVVR